MGWSCSPQHCRWKSLLWYQLKGSGLLGEGECGAMAALCSCRFFQKSHSLLRATAEGFLLKWLTGSTSFSLPSNVLRHSLPWTLNYCIGADTDSHCTSRQRLFWSHSDGRESLFCVQICISLFISLCACECMCVCVCVRLITLSCLIILVCVCVWWTCLRRRKKAPYTRLETEWGRREKAARQVLLLSHMQTGQWTPHGGREGGREGEAGAIQHVH